MRLISSLMGVAAAVVAAEDVMPTNGVLQRDLVAYLASAYGFQIFPQVGPGVPEAANPVLQFQHGTIKVNEQQIAINQLMIASDGDGLSAQDTDLADAALNDYLERMDQKFLFRYKSADIRRLHESFLIIEFNEKFLGASRLDAIGSLIANALKQDGVEVPYLPKRIAFGYDARAPALQDMSVTNLVPADIIIERRANEPFSRNRFFSSAPLTTAQHLRLLENIEAAMSS